MLSLPLQPHCRTIGDDLRYRLGYLTGVKAHHDDGVGTALLCFGDHAIDGMLARLLEHFGILIYLAADDGLESRENIADDAAAAHGNTEDLAKRFGDFM